ncbi:MAG: bifunctional phosphoserine phosphatase/homoserine phosphotransferase ThrH [Candidatus Lokiarchaeota archaeon]|nr:bifunctional phosphoserine phosphatase/homoserine phosphotransferase ThrH [Candidatus Lokiarchaeota archaeon]
MFVVCLDLEGVLSEEVWINVSLKTGIEELKLTTRDVSDYDVLMKRRLKILKENNITLKEIQNIIGEMDLLPGALEFLNWLRSVTQVIILTDSYIEFALPIVKKLGYPTLFCHDLETDEKGIISNYRLRIKNMKKQSVISFKNMNYDVIAIGDSYNDIDMLKEAKYGILFKPPKKVIEEYPEYPVITEYSQLKEKISEYIGLKTS